MQWLKWGSLAEISPVGLLAAGVILGAGSPTIKRGLRGLAVGITKSIISIEEQVRDTGERINGDLRDLMAEARANRETMPNNITDMTDFTNNTGQQLQDSIVDIKEEFTRMLSEAKEEIRQLKAELNNTPAEQS